MKNQLLSISISHSFIAASLMIISVLNRNHGEGLNECFCLSGNITLQKKTKLSIESCANARDYNIQIFQQDARQGPMLVAQAQKDRKYLQLHVKLSLCMPFFRRHSGTVIKPSLSSPQIKVNLGSQAKVGAQEREVAQSVNTSTQT